MTNNKGKIYFETLALQILKKFLNFNVDNFSKTERPDWINKKEGIGIEVTMVDDFIRFSSELERNRQK